MKPISWTAIALLATASACQPSVPAQSPAAAAAPTAVVASQAVASEAQQALDRLDTRTPVPLLPMMANHQKQNMRDHLLVVQEVVTALANDDFAAIERSAGRMGFSDQMAQMCTHMGAGAPGFTEQALDFHHTADTITEAAARRDRTAVTRALATTLQTCTGCHAAYRQSVVDEATWSRTTSTPPPTGHPQ